MKIKKTKEQIIAENKPRFNLFQGGNGEIVSAKYKGRKSKKQQKERNEMRQYEG